VRDAERLPWRQVASEARTPREPHVWVRIDGVWCKGFVVYWQRDQDGGWAAWTQHKIPRSETDWTEHAWFRYDPQTMRSRRDGDEPPEEE
jgi:hypothetical protein